MSRNSASDLLTDPDGLVVDSDATTQTGTARAQGQIHLESAELLLAQGQKAQAVTECIAGLNAGNLPAMTVAGLVLALRGAGQMDLANHVQVLAISQLTAFVKRNRNSGNSQINLGCFLHRVDMPDDAKKSLLTGLQTVPLNMRAVLALSDILLREADVEATQKAWAPVLAAQPKNGAIPLQIARLFAYRGFKDAAKKMLDVAEPLCATRRHEFEQVAAGIRGTESGSSQAAMTVEIFDSFSQSYDEKLKLLGNQGPEMASTVVAQLGFARKRRLDVLDAGCGTGLCAPFLRPLAKKLEGADLSPGMLTEAKNKNIYDLLTRSDLATGASLPAGPFDLIVSSDVLVYFGDLALVLTNFATILRPAGWLVITVEDAGDDGRVRGWVLDPSGRYKHTEAYLRSALIAAGFSGPKVIIRNTLRSEFGQPITGIALAAQRLALFAPH